MEHRTRKWQATNETKRKANQKSNIPNSPTVQRWNCDLRATCDTSAGVFARKSQSSKWMTTKKLFWQIHKIEAKKVQSFQTPATVLVLGGWNLAPNPARPAIYSRLYIVKIFWIGPRVPELESNFGQILNKIAITPWLLLLLGWNLDCRDIFNLHCNLNGKVNALMSTGAEIMVALNT